MLRQGKGTATEHQPVLSVYQPENHIVRVTTNRFRQLCSPDCSVFSKTQGHHGRTARAKAEVRDVAGFRGANRRVTLQEKDFSALQKAKSRTTKEITALGKHHCTPLTSVRNRSTFEANTGNI
jgi:hypothetical protein